MVGLRLLLCPLRSNVVLRTACCSVGIGLPVYSTFKAIENRDQSEQQKLLVYWAAYGSFSVAEVFGDKIFSRFPFYYHMKFAFLVWLQLPSSNWSRHLYMRHLRPFLLRLQARLGQIVKFIYGEMKHPGCQRFEDCLIQHPMIVARIRQRSYADPTARRALNTRNGNYNGHVVGSDHVVGREELNARNGNYNGHVVGSDANPTVREALNARNGNYNGHAVGHEEVELDDTPPIEDDDV